MPAGVPAGGGHSTLGPEVEVTVSLVPVFFLVALVFSVLGQGGGVLYTPVQVLAGVDFHVSAATSLFLIMTASLSSSLVFRKANRIDWPLAIVLEGVTTLGGLVGGMVSGRFSGTTLSLFFAFIVALAGVLMIGEFVSKRPARQGLNGLLAWRRTLGESTYVVNLALALPLSLLAGLVSGLVGVGGGILKVPMMVLLFGVPMEIAVGSSAFMVGLTAGGGFAGHLITGHWDWRTSLILAVAVFVGGQIGARLSVRIPRGRLKKSFGWFLLVIACYMGGRVVLA